MEIDEETKGRFEGPSKVVHIRGIPTDTTDQEVAAVALPFGEIEQILNMKTKHQALIQFKDETTAASMVNYYSYATPVINNQAVYVQYSNHKELKLDQHQSAEVNGEGSGLSQSLVTPTVLRVIVYNLLYPVTVDTLYQLFSKFGEVEKIIIFTRNQQFQALIQYHNSVECESAKESLNGLNIYNGCNTMRIDYSKLNDLTVKYNNEKSRDYTKLQTEKNAGRMEMGFPVNMNTGGVLPLPFSQGQGHIMGHGMGGHAMMPVSHFNPFGFSGNPMMAAAMARQGSVLLVSNLNDEQVTCDDLFVLFGHYGDVQRVKILYKKNDTALIQMSDSHQADLALSNLHGLRLYGKELRIVKSKHNMVNLPRGDDEQAEQKFTKDYANSPLHRFKKPHSKNFLNIFPPCATLHLSNIPETSSEEEIRQLFQSSGGFVEDFRFFPKDRRMALLKMTTLDDAVLAVIRIHNHKLSDTNYLRVSFAKSNM